MSLDDQQISNKMMTGAPEKKEFHFAGGGIWHNLTVVAKDIEEATKEWIAKRRAVSSIVLVDEHNVGHEFEIGGAEKTTFPALESPTEQSTPAPETAPPPGAVQ
jgi:hypothetical protein